MKPGYSSKTDKRNEPSHLCSYEISLDGPGLNCLGSVRWMINDKVTMLVLIEDCKLQNLYFNICYKGDCNL